MIIKNIIPGLLSLVLIFFSVQAQETAGTAGGDATGSGGTVAYTIGQVVYNTSTGTNGSVAQGVQQAYEISILTAINQSQGIQLTATTYPNPAVDNITLQIADYDVNNLSYEVLDGNGKIMESGKPSSSSTTIQLKNIAVGNYFLKIKDHQQEIKTFQLIKK